MPKEGVTTTDTAERVDGFVWQTDADGTSGPDGPGVRPIPERVGSLAVLLALLLAVASTLVLVPGSTLAHTSFTANDVVVTGNSGQLQSLSIAPSGDVHYDGLEVEPTAATITIEAKLASATSWETVDSTSISTTGLQGTANYSFASVDLLSATSMSRSDFAAADGSTSTTDVDVRVRVTLAGAGPDGSDVTASATDTLAVSVTNEPAGASAGGRANTGGNAA